MSKHSAADDPGDERFPLSDVREGTEPDYYAVLGVRPGASADEIRHAFYRLAKLWHPDRYMSAPAPLRERAERRMRALVAAHEVLADPVRRHAYDHRTGRSAVPTAHHAHGDARPDHAASPHPASAAASPHDPLFSARAGDNPNGVGYFFGLVCSVLALSMLVYVLGHPSGGFGSLVALGAFIVLGGLALWFFIGDTPPTRLASAWMESDPAKSGSRTQHKPRGASHPASHHTDPAPRPAAEHREPPPAADEPSDSFERLVADALATIPAEFQPYMDNVAVRVQPEPSAEDLAILGVREDGTLFGLYHGVNLTRQHAPGAPAPEEITIYQRPIERYCHGDPERIREEVRRTVLHELAHHFGIDHEDMPDWVR